MVDGTTFLWSVRHQHPVGQGQETICREVLSLRRLGASGRLLIVFQAGPGRVVPDGYAPSGAIDTSNGPWLNLHEPGTARAFLDEATARGWDPPSTPAAEQLDGRPLYETLTAPSRPPTLNRTPAAPVRPAP